MERYKKLSEVNLKSNLCFPILISILMCIITPCFMGTFYLDEGKTAKIFEYYVSFIGIILLMTIYMPEIDHEIRDLIRSKRENMLHLYILRFLQAFFILTVTLAIFLLVLKKQSCDFSFARLLYGTIANCLFLSGLGLLCYAISDQIVLAYMLPFTYYMLNYATGERYVGKLYLFSMTNGEFSTKHYLFAIGSLFIVISMVIKKIRG